MKIKSTKELRKLFHVKGVGIWRFEITKGRIEDEYHISAKYSYLAIPIIFIRAIACGFINFATGFVECLSNCNPKIVMFSHYCSKTYNSKLYKLVKKDIDKLTKI